MSENKRARDLMIESFWRIEENQTVSEAIRRLLAGGKGSQVLVAVDDDDAFLGLLTPRLLLRGLFGRVEGPEGEPSRDAEPEARLFDAARNRLEQPVRDLLVRDISCANVDDGLLRLTELTSDQRLECVPVLEEGRVVGVLRLVDVFGALAALALVASPSR